MVDVPAAPVAHAPAGGPFAGAWRNYLKSVLKKGYMYFLSSNPSVVFYVAENKTLAGKEDRTYEGEALGRKLASVFFELAEGGLVRRVQREGMGMQQHMLTLAEILQTIGGHGLPPDPERTAATTELLLESLFQDMEILRSACSLEPHAPDVHMFSLEPDVNAEAAFALESPAEHRTKMVLARALQRHHELLPGETLQNLWNLSLGVLRARTAPLFPALHGPPLHDLEPPPAPAPLIVPGRGRGGPAGPVGPVAPAGRGRGRGRGRRGGRGPKA